MLKIAIIGSGFGLYGLLPAFNSKKGCRVVAISGKSSPRLEQYCKEIGLIKIYDNWNEMLEKETLDAVAIAVPPKAQYEIAKVAISKGLNIFAEKPLAANLIEARELYELAKKKNITTAVDFIFPEIKLWKKAKKIIDGKIVGQLESIEVKWLFLSYDLKNKISSWKTDIKQGGGALSFYGCHVLYYLEYFAGEILNLKGHLSFSKRSLNKGDSGVNLTINFKNGVKGKVKLSANSPVNTHQLIFKCTKGKIILENLDNKVTKFSLKVYAGNKLIKSIFDKNKTKDEDERVEVVKTLATRFIDGCNTKKEITPSFKEGFRVQQLIENIRLNT